MSRARMATKSLKIASVLVWERIKFARTRRGLKIYETTITQDLIHLVTLFSPFTKSSIHLLEAKSERTNGNDIELFIETKDGFVCCAVQSKIIYKNKKYPKVRHPSKKYSFQQIDQLIDYANRMKGVPIYFFYNFIDDEILMKKLFSKVYCYWGVSFISAYTLKRNFYKETKKDSGFKKWEIPNFIDVVKIGGMPLFKILDYISSKTFLKDGINRPKFYTRNEVFNSKEWKYENVGINKPFQKFKIIKNSDLGIKYTNDIFNPKFRFVLELNDSSNHIILTKH